MAVDANLSAVDIFQSAPSCPHNNILHDDETYTAYDLVAEVRQRRFGIAFELSASSLLLQQGNPHTFLLIKFNIL